MKHHLFAPISRSHRLVGTATLLVLALTLASCGINEPVDCSGSFSLTTTSLTPPTFTWSPRCRISSLEVFTVSTPETPVWAVGASDPVVGPPIRYGQVPSEFTVLVPAQSLAFGRSYRVVASIIVGGAGLVIQSSFTFYLPFPPD